jgi:D-amino-acid dehydrogenase
MKVIVLGAGLLGVTSAYFLRQHGHDVTVVDRQASPAAETSFANGGQISVSHAEPWANPSAPFKVLKWLGKEDAPLLFRLRADRRQWLWGLQFLRECTPARTRHNIEQIVRLGTYSRDTLQQLRRDRDIAYDERTQGILHFYTSQKEFDGAEAPAAQMRALGCDRRVISADAAVKLEPALAHIRPRLAGATYTAEDESGDANRFARELVKRCEEDGVQFLMSHTITALREAGGAIDHVEATDNEGRFQRLRADAYVLAMGSLSPMYAAPLGIALPIYPAKGYSVTMPVKDATMAHQVSLTDGHAQQRADHRPLEAAQPVPEHRPRHARLDACLRFRQEHCAHRERSEARGGLCVHGVTGCCMNVGSGNEGSAERRHAKVRRNHIAIIQAIVLDACNRPLCIGLNYA